jgi:hypothetical protein
LINFPGHTFLFKKIIDGRDTSGDIVVIVVNYTIVGSTTGSNIVWLRRMGNGIEVI